MNKLRWIICLSALLMLLIAMGFMLAAPSDSSQSGVTSMADLGLMLLDVTEGVSVLAVQDQSPADRAGILPGDLLLQADGTAFHSIEQLESLLYPLQQHAMQLQLQRTHEEILTVRLNLH